MVTSDVTDRCTANKLHLYYVCCQSAHFQLLSNGNSQIGKLFPDRKISDLLYAPGNSYVWVNIWIQTTSHKIFHTCFKHAELILNVTLELTHCSKWFFNYLLNKLLLPGFTQQSKLKSNRRIYYRALWYVKREKGNEMRINNI